MERIFYEDVRTDAMANENFLNVAFTDPERGQLVLMSIPPKESVDMEIAQGTQFIFCCTGKGSVFVGNPGDDIGTYVNPPEGSLHAIQSDMMVVVPAGAPRRIQNIKKDDHLQIYIIYTSPVYPAKTKQKHKYNPRYPGPEELLREMQFAIARQSGSIKEYLQLCQTSEAHFRKCLAPGHWGGVIAELPMIEALDVIRFASQYVDTTPSLLTNVIDVYERTFKKQLDDMRTFFGPQPKLRVRAKAKAAKGAKKTAEQTYRDELEKIKNQSRKIFEKVEEKLFKDGVIYGYEYGPVENITPQGRLFKLYEKIATVLEINDDNVRFVDLWKNFLDTLIGSSETPIRYQDVITLLGADGKASYAKYDTVYIDALRRLKNTGGMYRQYKKDPSANGPVADYAKLLPTENEKEQFLNNL